MKRKSTKKSRHGCSECKRRHVKCDETRPSCANCNVRRQRCSFLSSLPLPQRAAPIGTSPYSPSPVSASASASASGAPGSPQSDAADLTLNPNYGVPESPPWALYEPPFSISSLVTTDQTFKLHHLELLHNFKAGVLGESVFDLAAADGYMAMTVREAVEAPYLMDQALAVSAAHMSVKRPNQRYFYLKEATQLQTRALTLFNSSRVLEKTGHTMAGFVFSTLLSQQVLFDAFSSRTDFPALLDKLVAAFRICGGVRLVCRKSWPFIMTQYQQHVGISFPHEFMGGAGPETILTKKLADLKCRIADANLGPLILDPCNTALQYLQELSYAEDRGRVLYFRATHLLQWAVRVPPSFIDLVEQRRPEALIIIAYYALLIHDTKGYWISGDAGTFIIRSITSFLGKYWTQWLAWPNEVLDSIESSHAIIWSPAIDTGQSRNEDPCQHRVSETA